MLKNIWNTRKRHYVIIIYEVDEVFPWRGITMIFSVCVPISRANVPSRENDFWLDFKYLDMVHRATKK